MIKIVRIRSLQTKLVITIGLIVILTISILGTILLKISSNALSDSIINGFVSSGKGIVKTINYMTLYEQKKIEKFKNDKRVLDFLEYGVGKENVEDLIINDNDNNANSFETYVVNNEGIIVASNLPSSIGSDVKIRDYFHVVKGSLEPYTSDILVSITTGKTMATIAQPILNDNGEFLGMVGRDINTTYYKDVLDDFKTENSNIFILDNNGYLLFHDNVNMIGKPINIKAIDEILTDKSNKAGIIEYDLNKQYKIATYSTIEEIGWKVFSSGNVDSLFKSVKKMRLVILQLLVVIIAISLIIITYCSRYIVKPIKLLYEKIGLVAQGDFTVRLDKIKTDYEIDMLVNAFNSMMNDLEFIISAVEGSFDSVDEECNRLINVTEEITDHNNEKVNLISNICSKNTNVLSDLEVLKNNINKLDIININLVNNNILVHNEIDVIMDLLEKLNGNIMQICSTNSSIVETIGNLKNDLEKESNLEKSNINNYYKKINHFINLEKSSIKKIYKISTDMNKLSLNLSMVNLSEISEAVNINKELIQTLTVIIEEIKCIERESMFLYDVTVKKSELIEDSTKSIRTLGYLTMTVKSLTKLFKVDLK